MALLSWSDEYLIGNLTIDTEHRELFRLINRFHDHWREKQDYKDIAQVLNQLATYAQMHFQHEENTMATAQYPRLNEHQNIHESMFITIFELRQSFEKNDTHLEMDTMKFVKDWVIEHIVHNDYLFRDHLVRQKKKEEIAAQQSGTSPAPSLANDAPMPECLLAVLKTK